MGPLAISQPKEHCQSCFVCPLLWDWIAGRRRAVSAFQRREVNTLERRTDVESCCCPYLSLGWGELGRVHQIWNGEKHQKGRTCGLKGSEKKNTRKSSRQRGSC